MSHLNYNELELKIVRWGEDRGIVQNGKPMGQAIKTLEEVGELIDAIHIGDRDAIKDAYGDIVVTLLMGAATQDIDLKQCIALAYSQIKDRKGYLRADGVFVKDV